MADLFLSYAREDRECAEMLAGALTERGWNVWWDRRIQVGRSFSDVIERQLDQARCVVVLWSQASVRSEWVQNEAAEAARKNRLVPVRIEDVRPPLEFRRLQTADLLDWQNGLDHCNLAPCMESIEFLARHTASRPLPAWTIVADDTAPSDVSFDPVMAAVNAVAAVSAAAAAKQRVIRRNAVTVLSSLAIVWVGQFYDGDENKGVLMLEIAIIAVLFIFCWDRMRWPIELLLAYGRRITIDAGEADIVPLPEPFLAKGPLSSNEMLLARWFRVHRERDGNESEADGQFLHAPVGEVRHEKSFGHIGGGVARI